MKKLLTSIALLFAAANIWAAGNITLAWDPNPAADQVNHYTLYQATGAAGLFVKVADIPGNTVQYAVTGLAPGVYKFYVTASNMWTESDPSNTVTTPSGVSPTPKNLVIKVIVIIPTP